MAAAGGPRFGWRTLAVVLVLGLLGGWLLARRAQPKAKPTASHTELALAIAQAEQHVGPAVVTLDVESRRNHGQFAPQRGSTSRMLHSQGSGLIVDPRGYIVTNRHVVEGALQIAVHLARDEHTYYATLKGEDPDTDLAVIKIDAPRPLPAISLGNAEPLGVGDWVVAIGSPFGLPNTVTAGIVSALHRALDPRQQFQSFIQTDAPINPGNSGGPLVNLKGQVVGINTAIYTETDGYQGIGFAVPSSMAEHVYRELVRQGHVTRGSIGVYFESKLSPAVRQVYHIPTGVPLTEVAAKGPAAKAGLQAGDIITSVNGRTVNTGTDLMDDIEFYPVGATVRIGYERDGKPHNAELQVADRARLYASATKPSPKRVSVEVPATPADFGMALEGEPKGKGVRVMAVQPDSFADNIGVDAGDLIVQINGHAVHNRKDWNTFSASVHPGQDMALLLQREADDGTTSRWMVGGTVPPPLGQPR